MMQLMGKAWELDNVITTLFHLRHQVQIQSSKYSGETYEKLPLITNLDLNTILEIFL